MTIFEQILANERVINENIMQVASNVQQLYDEMHGMMNPDEEPLQPMVSGDEGNEQ